MIQERHFSPDQLLKARSAAKLESLAAADVELTPTSDGRLIGPCPFCGEGTDRFHVYPDGQRFWCRRCGERGDLVQYVMKRRGLSFVDAVQHLLGGDVGELPTVAIIPAAMAVFDPDRWISRLEPMVYHAIDHLGWQKSPAAVGAANWLEARGITMQDAGRFGLGYNPEWQNIYGDFRLPPGLIIPRWQPGDMALTAVNVYLDRENRERYGRRRLVRGSQARSWFGAHLVKDDTQTVIITEGELDCILLNRFLSPMPCTQAITAGAVNTMPESLDLLNGRHVVLIFDNDDAGQTAVKTWQERIPGARVATVPQGKDITDLWKLSGDDGMFDFVTCIKKGTV